MSPIEFKKKFGPGKCSKCGVYIESDVELYVATNRHNLAVERLDVLKGCNCEEYEQLKAVIAGEASKY